MKTEGQKIGEHKTAGKKGTLLRLGGYLMRYKWYLVGAVALTVGSNLFSLIGPLLSGYAVDAIEPGPGKVLAGLWKDTEFGAEHPVSPCCSFENITAL